MSKQLRRGRTNSNPPDILYQVVHFSFSRGVMIYGGRVLDTTLTLSDILHGILDATSTLDIESRKSFF